MNSRKASPFSKEPAINDFASPSNQIDVSLLNDEERAYYFRHGKLPPSPEQEEMLNNLNLKNDLEDTPQKETPPQEVVKETVEEVVVETPTPQEALQHLGEDITNNMDTNATEPIVGEDGVVNWDTYKEPAPVQEEIPAPTVETPEPVLEVKETVVETPVQVEPNEVYVSPPSGMMDISPEGKVTQVTEEVIVEKKDEKEEVILKEKVQSPVKEIVNDSNDAPEDTTPENPQELIAADDDYQTVYRHYQNATQELIKKYQDESGDISDADLQALEEDARDPNSTIYRLQLLNGMATANRDFEQRIINELSLPELREITPNAITPKSSSKSINTAAIKDPDKVVKGTQAKMLITSRTRGTKRVFLMNSGFWVVVRPLANYELSEFINTIRTDTNEYGRTLGGYFYVYADYLVKHFFADKITSIITDSNLENFKRAGVLMENIKLQDFKTILWACASLMFKDGVAFTKICSKCAYEESVMMDLSKLYFTNFDAIKEKAYPFIASKKSVSINDIKEYQSLIDFGISNVIKVDNWEIHCHVPSIKEYIDCAEMFAKKLREEVSSMDNNDAVQEFTRFTYLKQYTPWITEMVHLDENGEVLFRIRDIETIFDNISNMDLEDTDIVKKMDAYIEKTMLTYIAFPYVKCPACGYVPQGIKNGFVAYDIETSFFTMCVRRSQEVYSILRASNPI